MFRRSRLEMVLNFLFENHLLCMEIEFVRGVYYVNTEKLNKNIIYSVHAPYYINFNAKEEDKIEKSFLHVIRSAEELKNFGKVMGVNDKFP